MKYKVIYLNGEDHNDNEILTYDQQKKELIKWCVQKNLFCFMCFNPRRVMKVSKGEVFPVYVMKL